MIDNDEAFTRGELLRHRADELDRDVGGKGRRDLVDQDVKDRRGSDALAEGKSERFGETDQEDPVGDAAGRHRRRVGEPVGVEEELVDVERSEDDAGPPMISVPRDRDALGRVTESVETVDPLAAEHWDERLWWR